MSEGYHQKRDIAARQYQKLLESQQPVRLKKVVSNLFRERRGKAALFDVSSFDGVISIDATKLVADVEGMATYRTVVDATLAHGLLPAVVPELATITVGGAVSGGGIEASSFRYGLVHETVLAMDVLLPNGEVVTATPNNQYQDLFYGMANSFGTLGYILKLTIKLIPAKRFVHLTYHQFDNMNDLLAKIESVAKTGKHQGRNVDFMDGVGFGAHQLYVCLGRFVDTAPYIGNYRYNRRYYRSILRRNEDYLTARDFIWRWDSDWFWCSKNFYMDRLLLRLLFGKFMLRSESYWRLLRLNQRWHIAEKLRWLSGQHQPMEDVIQDVQVPIEQAAAFWNYFTKHIPIQPVWFCPTRSARANQHPLYELQPDQTYINFGFWDQVEARPDDPHYHNKQIEKQVSKLDGKKGLYSQAFYSQTEFWRLYNGPAYKKLKAKYDPKKRLKDLYQKCVEQS